METLSFCEFDIKSGSGYLNQHNITETYPLHNHDFYEVFYVYSGYALHHINDEIQPLAKGAYVFIRPFDTHQYDYLKSYDFGIISIGIPISELRLVCAYMEYDITSLKKQAMPIMVQLDGVQGIALQSSMEKLATFHDCDEKRLYFHSILPQLLYPFCIQHELPRTDLPSWFVQVLEEMNKEENYIQGLPRLLSLAGCSQEHITRCFHQFLKITPTAFINELRLSLAYSRILYTKDTIIEVAYQCGFHNISHFYHLFRKQYKISPAKLRK